ncbi:MAG: type III secretion system stator protein SctL [Methylibium sp.]|nr:type III secretion system stator protein SctL [Methylibium sp.]MBA3623626.1 type III secretion system stator protein SctL [Methylibium sp.]
MDLVVLIDLPELTVASKSRLLKKADAEHLTQAADVLERTRARDQLMLKQTLNGYEQARQRGRRQGLAQAEAEWAGRLAAAAAAKQLALRDLAPTMIDLVVDATALVLRNADRRQLMTAALQAVDGLLKQARWARLRVHPSQADAARETLGEFDARHSGAALITVVPDPSLKPEDCIFETDVGIADASLDVQLGAIRSALEKAVASHVERAQACASATPLRSEAS